MNADDRITLREHFDKIISIRFESAAERARIAAEAQDKALEIAAAELSRRLDLLNHAHEQALEVQERFLPRELYETRLIEMEKRILAIERTIWAVGGVAIFVAFATPLVVNLMGK